MRVIKLRRWVGHVPRVGESRGGYGVLWGDLRKRQRLEDTSVDGGMDVKMDVQQVEWGHGLD
jgi:hypothetical protein